MIPKARLVSHLCMTGLQHEIDFLQLLHEIFRTTSNNSLVFRSSHEIQQMVREIGKRMTPTLGCLTLKEKLRGVMFIWSYMSMPD